MAILIKPPHGKQFCGNALYNLRQVYPKSVTAHRDGIKRLTAVTVDTNNTAMINRIIPNNYTVELTSMKADDEITHRPQTTNKETLLSWATEQTNEYTGLMRIRAYNLTRRIDAFSRVSKATPYILIGLGTLFTGVAGTMLYRKMQTTDMKPRKQHNHESVQDQLGYLPDDTQLKENIFSGFGHARNSDDHMDDVETPVKPSQNLTPLEP